MDSKPEFPKGGSDEPSNSTVEGFSQEIIDLGNEQDLMTLENSNEKPPQQGGVTRKGVNFRPKKRANGVSETSVKPDNPPSVMFTLEKVSGKWSKDRTNFKLSLEKALNCKFKVFDMMAELDLTIGEGISLILRFKQPVIPVLEMHERSFWTFCK